MATNIWVVGAGKGGVGKTFLTASLGVCLAKQGPSVLCVDLDVHGANLHTHLGQHPASTSVQSYFVNKAPLPTLIQSTTVPRLSFIQGPWDQWAPLSLSGQDVEGFVQELRKLPFDYVLIDLGPGASDANLDFFRLADEKILVTNPEPTSVEKTYRFLESMISRKLRTYGDANANLALASSLQRYRSQQKSVPFSFRDFLKNTHGFSMDFFDDLKEHPIRLIVNQARSQQDQDLGHSIKSVSVKYYDFPLDFLGALDFDNAVWQSVRARQAFLVEKPFSPVAGELLAITRHLSATNPFTNPYRQVS
jgi:flagellar biosynthesis protein FlhG